MRLTLLILFMIVCVSQSFSQLYLSLNLGLKAEKVQSSNSDIYSPSIPLGFVPCVSISKRVSGKSELDLGLNFIHYAMRYKHIKESGISNKGGGSFMGLRAAFKYEVFKIRKIGVQPLFGFSFNRYLQKYYPNIEGNHFLGVGEGIIGDFSELYILHLTRTHFTTLYFGLLFNFDISKKTMLYAGIHRHIGFYKFMYSDFYFTLQQNLPYQYEKITAKGDYIEWVCGIKIRISKN